VPRSIRRADGVITDLAGCRLRRLADQHAFLEPVWPGDPLPVVEGDWIGLGLSHPCTVFDKWRLIPVVGGPGGTTVIDLIRTFF
jgi:D-serine deaminase-like pyridoxal phosphate-dependent protein